MDDHAKPGPNGSESERDGAHGGATNESGAERAQSPTDAINAVRGLVEHMLEEGLSRVKGESGKLGGRASQSISGMLSEFGVAQRRDHEDLELRIAQLEHRVRLLEDQQDAGGEAASSSAASAAGDSDAAESPADS